MTDRFNRVGGYSAGNQETCTGGGWCNGTFAGVQEQLSYIKGMGFDCIWITPIVENPAFEAKPGDDEGEGCGSSGFAYHGYWAQNYYNTDPHFGTKEEFKALVDAAHDHDLCIILDIVTNHMSPTHPSSPWNVELKVPFDKPEYYNQLDIGNKTWDEYTSQWCHWPSPAQNQLPGSLCRLDVDQEGEPDFTNGGNYCNNYKAAESSETLEMGTYVGEDAAGPPEIKYCLVGNCPHQNETRIWEGWFFDLGDLNHSHPYVVEKQLEWVRWLISEFDIDAIRLDTVPYMPWDYLSKLQATAYPVQIIGEITTGNVTFHAFGQKRDDFETLGGLQNFPTFYRATPAFCGDANQPNSPTAAWNLTELALAQREQLNSGVYTNVHTLMNFADNQDYTPIAVTCRNHTQRIKNILAWVFFSPGMPMITFGTEQGNIELRKSMWSFEWNTTTWQYTFIRQLNAIRKLVDLSTMETEIFGSTQDTLILRRFRDQHNEVYIFTNSLGRPGSLTYLARPVPIVPNCALRHKCFWVNAFTGKEAKFTHDGFFESENSDPVVLIPSSLWSSP